MLRLDFKSAKRYAWGKNHIITRQGRANDALIDQKIVQEVNRNLQAKGFTEDPMEADFCVFYEAGSSDLAVDVEGAYMDHPLFLPLRSVRSMGNLRIFGTRSMAILHFTWWTPKRTKRYGPLWRRRKSVILTKV
jgi:hypothetical protein